MVRLSYLFVFYNFEIFYKMKKNPAQSLIQDNCLVSFIKLIKLSYFLFLSYFVQCLAHIIFFLF